MRCYLDDDKAVEMLVDRVQYWTDDREVVDLYERYYENAVANGYWEGCEFNVMSIVDNDYVSNTEVVYKDDCSEETWAEILERYDNGDVEISDIEDCSGQRILAMNDDKTMILVDY